MRWTLTKPTRLLACLQPKKLPLGSRTFSRTSPSRADPNVQKKINEYSRLSPCALSIQQFIEFGHHKEDIETAMASAEFLFQKELPIRIAHMCKIMDGLPESFRLMPNIIQGRKWYEQSMNDILLMQSQLRDGQRGHRDLVLLSVNICKGILARHANIVPLMVSGLHELLDTRKAKQQDVAIYNRFLDELFMSRIGTRLCLGQHMELFEPLVNPENKQQSAWGLIEEHLDLKKLLLESFGRASKLCTATYGHAPKLNISMYSAEGKKTSPQQIPHATPTLQNTFSQVDKLTFSDVPSHLYHILFELLKNSMRAVCETHGTGGQNSSLPAIRAILVKAEHDLTIKIEDQGGGVPCSQMEQLWLYSYTTAPRPNFKTMTFDMNGLPMAGFGYGLPLSRLYSRYFGGDLRLVSTEGYGMDSLIYRQAIASDAKETLTVVQQDDGYGSHFKSREDLIAELAQARQENQELRHCLSKVGKLVGDTTHAMNSRQGSKIGIVGVVKWLVPAMSLLCVYPFRPS
eukprot:g1481.t1